jgi:hypothetical protein
MVLVALKLHPELVKASFHYDSSSNSLTTGGKTRISTNREAGGDQSSNRDSEWTDSVQFLPHTETTSSAVDQKNKGSKTLAPQNLESIINAGPIYYHQKVPSYVPDNSVARGNVT